METVVKEEKKPPKQESDKVTIQRDRSGHYGLHISNISTEINESDLRSLFGTSGFVKICKIIKTVDNDRVAFVKFTDHDEAIKALKKLNNTKLGSTHIVIRPAYESQRPYRNRFHRERTGSAESLSKSSQRERKGNASVRNEQRNSVEEKPVGEQKQENSDVYYASQDVRHVGNSDPTPVSTSSPGKNMPAANSSGNTMTQVDSTAASTSGSYMQSPWGSRAPDAVSTKSNQQSYHPQGPNKPQRFPGTHGNYSYTMTNSNPATVFSTGRASPPKGFSYQSSPRTAATYTNNTQNSYTNSGPANNMYTRSSSNNTQTVNQYAMQNSTLNPHFSQPCEISKPMRDLSISSPGFAYSPANISKWSVEDVIKYFKTKEESTKSMVDFLEEQEIDGNALMLLEEESLLHFMKLGPALKLLNLRDKLKQ